MDKFFDNFYNYKGFGPTIDKVIPSDNLCADYRGILPDQLIAYWQEYGFSGWGDGLLWIVNPRDYDSILKAWLEDTPFEGKDDYHVIARSAFGSLNVWGQKTGASIDIHSSWGMLFPNDQTDKLLRRGSDRVLQSFFSTMSKEEFNLTDEENRPLFDRAKDKLGVLNHDEMYAFVPALALGGKADLKFLQKVNIIEHLAFLADLGEKRIMADVNKVLGPVKI